MTKFLFGLSISAMLLLSSQTTMASNLSFLSSTSVASLTKSESKNLQGFIKEQLEQLSDFSKAKWESKRGSSALFKITASYVLNEDECKRIKLALRAAKQARYQTLFFDLCRQEGEWSVIESPLASITKEQHAELADYVNETLNQGQNDFPYTFSISGTSITVVMVPEDLDTDATSECRQLALAFVDAQGGKFSGKYVFCHQGDDTWKHRGAAS